MALETRDFQARHGRPNAARFLSPTLPDRLQAMRENAEVSISERFKGVTTDGTVIPGLYSIGGNGASNQGTKVAVGSFIAALNAEQRAAAQFPLDGDAWRR